MQRIPEPELMDEAEQARAYALADFAEPNQRFVELLRSRVSGTAAAARSSTSAAGPATSCCGSPRGAPGLTVHGIDGSAAMLRFAAKRLHARARARRSRAVHRGPAAGRHAAAGAVRRRHQQQPAAPPARSGGVLVGRARGGRARRRGARHGPVPAAVAARRAGDRRPVRGQRARGAAGGLPRLALRGVRARRDSRAAAGVWPRPAAGPDGLGSAPARHGPPAAR